ncbi:hypothetical protein BDE36_3318 [Arcticibacter tournemirensis]|nr:hypothetical protein BDE36_3318 [Arcticibacter tournemirensis]
MFFSGDHFDLAKGGQFTLAEGDHFALAEGGIFNWPKGVSLVCFIHILNRQGIEAQKKWDKSFEF